MPDPHRAGRQGRAVPLCGPVGWRSEVRPRPRTLWDGAPVSGHWSGGTHATVRAAPSCRFLPVVRPSRGVHPLLRPGKWRGWAWVVSTWEGSGGLRGGRSWTMPVRPGRLGIGTADTRCHEHSTSKCVGGIGGIPQMARQRCTCGQRSISHRGAGHIWCLAYTVSARPWAWRCQPSGCNQLSGARRCFRETNVRPGQEEVQGGAVARPQG